MKKLLCLAGAHSIKSGMWTTGIQHGIKVQKLGVDDILLPGTNHSPFDYLTLDKKVQENLITFIPHLVFIP